MRLGLGIAHMLKWSLHNQQLTQANATFLRNLSGRRDDERPLMLMELPAPSGIYLSARIKIAMNMKRFDPEFVYSEFKQGARKAASKVSHLISNGEFESLKDLVADSSIATIKKNYNLLSAQKKKMIAFDESHAQIMFPYSCEIVWEPRKLAKIGMIISVVPIDPFMIGKVESPHLMLTNYSFVKERSKDYDSGWFISELNHTIVTEKI